MTIVNIFTCQPLTHAQELHPRCGMDARTASKSSEICNGKESKKLTVQCILTVISSDSVELTSIAEN